MKKLKYRSGRSVGLSVAILSSYLLPVGESQASVIVNPGWDLFVTDSATNTFAGFAFEGVPLDPFDFGGSIGVQNVGATDTIVQRLDQAVGPGLSTTIDIELVALQLRSVAPIDLGMGTGIYYATLNPDNPSLGTMDISFDANHGDPDPELHTGTFNSRLDVRFDIRFETLDGEIVPGFENMGLDLISLNDCWDHTWDPIPGVPLINGVNHELNGTDISTDFWGVPSHSHGLVGAKNGGGAHPIPEVTSSFALAGLLGLSMFMRKRS